jgi:hypothetical protein
MSRGKTNNDFVFPFLGNAKLALKLANAKWKDPILGCPPPPASILSVHFIDGSDDIEPTEGPGPLFAVFSEDGEYMVNCKTIEWENVA